MRKQCLTVGIAVLCSAGLAAAPSAQNTAGAKKTDKTSPGTVVVTGCVGPSTDGQGYVLNEAIMAPRPVDKKSSDRPAAAPGGDKTVMSYLLDGGDMKTHVGQKVEISGTKIAENTMAMDHKDLGGTLKVKSVKMIAASCK
jgi:hypothetical protein